MWYNKESLRLLIIGDEKMVKDIFELIEKEKKRQDENIELIASENFVSEDVKKKAEESLLSSYKEYIHQVVINSIKI